MIKINIEIEQMLFFATVFAFFMILILVTWDVPYFVRTTFIVVWGRLFEKKRKPNETTTIYGVCTTSDLDIVLKHMNNARYVRELDFARFHFYDRTGIYSAITAAKGTAFQTACIIKYRRTIPIFTFYKIVTKMVYWDNKCIYLEQQFVSLKDNFVKAIVYSKQVAVGPNVEEIIAKLLDEDVTHKPEMSEEIKHFIACMDASSATLRKKDD
ncbi:hypothetical protein FQA39_LY10265 [Lamprigera yunnana]|nr:hypothetical protein FQA39_LY10265 [Lamprigera yunnana]